MNEKGKNLEDLPTIEEIDKMIHEPARLIILSYLYVLESADYLFLRNNTGLTWGNLSSHLSKLEEAGFLDIKKDFVQKKPHSMVELTKKGRKSYEDYRERMKKFLK